ncbi:MAG: hypothetical protein VX619_11100 [bacterium]|nr:hypothetical protein [bacterium]
MSAEKFKTELVKTLNEIFPITSQLVLADYHSFLMKEYFLGLEITLPEETCKSFLEQDLSNNLSTSTIIFHAGEFRLFHELFYFQQQNEPRWVLLLKAIRNFTISRFENFPETFTERDNPGSEIKLLKIFEWQSENPDNFPPLVLITTSILRLVRMGWIDKPRDLYFFCSFALANEGLVSFAYSRNLEVEFKKLVQCEVGEEDTVIAKFSRFLYQQIAVSREEFGEKVITKNKSEKNLSEPEFLFGKGIRDCSNVEILPDPQLLHEEAEFIAQESFLSFQRHSNNLANVDQDLKYITQQSHYDRKRLPSILKILQDYTNSSEIMPSEIRWFHESQVKLIAPHGSYWRGKIPENQMLVLTIELRDQIMQLYLMELLWKYVDPKSILKKDVVHREVLRRIYILDLKTEEASRDWISINREVFFQFLGRLEEETVKWNKRKESSNRI